MVVVTCGAVYVVMYAMLALQRHSYKCMSWKHSGQHDGLLLMRSGFEPRQGNHTYVMI